MIEFSSFHISLTRLEHSSQSVFIIATWNRCEVPGEGGSPLEM